MTVIIMIFGFHHIIVRTSEVDKFGTLYKLFEKHFSCLKPKENYNFVQDKGFENSKSIIEALKRQDVTSIGAAGYCWGGELLLLLL